MGNVNKNIEEAARATAYVMERHEEIKNNPLRQKYHFEVPAGWCNDPNGFSILGGKYHLFYQHMPYVSEPGDYKMYWGHAVSENLVDWEDLPVALAPVDECDEGGCWSGCALELDQKVYLMYTGLDARNGMQQGQCMAVSDDGIHFTKTEDSPILADTLCEADKKDFRDPYIWRQNGEWNMILGSTKDHFAQALLYRSNDLKNWRFINTMAESLGELGSVCECPNFFEIGGKYILFISPHGLNLRKSVYLTGNFDYPAGKFFWDTYGEIDWGMDYYAPQVIKDGNGRCIMIGWMNSWNWMPWCDGTYYTSKMGWCGGMALPRELRLDEVGRLHFEPVQELKNYRTEPAEMVSETAGEEGISIETADNSHCEMIIDFNLKGTTAEIIQLEVKSNEKEKVLVNLNLKLGEIEFDRSHTFDHLKSKRRCSFRSVSETACRIHVFIDSASVELFTDDYMTCMTNTVYVPENADRIKIRGIGGRVKILKVQSWAIKKN